MRVYPQLDMEFPPASTVVALGLFDGLHPGHVAVIRRAVDLAREGGKTPCVFTFSTAGELPASKNGGALLSQELFASLLEELEVEVVVRPAFADFRAMDAPAFARDILGTRLGAAAVVCGENFRFGRGAAGDVAALRSTCEPQIRVEAMAMVGRNGAAISASRIRERVRAGDMEEAARLLARPFAIDFEVVHGRALGRTLGSPTINQPFPPYFIRPKYGVYATRTRLEGQAFVSVTNVGVKPTVGGDSLLAETYIHGFSGDLYGARVRVDFLRLIRPERKFDSIEELREQILRDSEEASRIAGEQARAE